MKKLDFCPFCGSDEVEVVSDVSPKEKHFYVQCYHCTATGSSFGSIALVDGDFEETDEELTTAAVDAWNKCGRPGWWHRLVKRRLAQIHYDCTLVSERWKERK